MFDSVRVRLTLWYVAILALMSTVFSAGAFVLVRHEVYEKTDLILKSVCTATLSLMRTELNENTTDKMAARRAVESLNFPYYSSYSLAIFDPQGNLLAQKGLSNASDITLPYDSSLPDGVFQVSTVPSSGPNEEPRRYVLVRTRLEPKGRSYTVVASRGLNASFEEANADRRILFVAVPLGLLFAGFGGWFLARKNLAPVLEMSKQARRIGVGNLDQRLPVVNPRDELGQLAATFNSLLSRLSSAFAFQRQFMTDASHELRTPVYVIRTSTSVTLEKKHRSEDEYRNALTIIDEQVRRLARIVDDMFRLAKADAGRLTLQQCPFYLDEVLSEAARAAKVLGQRKEIAVHLGQMPESLCYGDEALVREMVSNLLDNAIKFTPRSGEVTLNLERKNGLYLISVSDTGTGIPRECQARVFDRFFRAEKTDSHSSDFCSTGGGAGLGLSIAQSIAEAHGGRVSLERSDSNGTTFSITLPSGSSSPTRSGNAH